MPTVDGIKVKLTYTYWAERPHYQDPGDAELTMCGRKSRETPRYKTLKTKKICRHCERSLAKWKREG